MSSTSSLETRVGALISAYADRAPIDVDPMAMTRSAAASGDRRWRPTGFMPASRGSMFVLLALALMVTVVAGALVVGATRLRSDPVDLLVERAFVSPFVGLPPEGAVPSTPETGQLVFSFGGRVGWMDLDFHRMWVYADGRLIWKSNLDGTGGGAGRSRFGTSEPTTAVVEQRLTPMGVELMRSEVMATARILGPKQVGEDLTESGRPGVLWGGMAIGAGDLILDASWSDHDLPGRLADPGSWLPPSAWTDRRIGAYVSTRYAVCLWPGNGAATIDRVPEPARTLIVANGTEIAAFGEPTPDCLQVTTDVARDIAAALDATDLLRSPLDVGLGYRLRNQGADRHDLVRILPIVPHGEIVCSCG